MRGREKDGQEMGKGGTFKELHNNLHNSGFETNFPFERTDLKND
jgi:hypothetical protein